MRFIKLFLILLALLIIGFTSQSQAANNHVDVIQVTDTINPAIYEYISEAIVRAEKDGAECLIIQLDTPGGLLTSTQKIVRDILNSKVPVVVYISPSGSWAASAGTFITLASNIAAMAPSTNIGAAHPVGMTSPSQNKKSPQTSKEQFKKIEKKLDNFMNSFSDKEKEGNENKEKSVKDNKKKKKDSEKKGKKEASEGNTDIMSEKIMQNTTAWIRGIAHHRGKNVDWAEKAVSQSLSITETEALKKNVIDLIADDLDDLLVKINGRKVKIGKKEITLNTKNVRVDTYKMTLRQKILSTISNPNLFFILVLLGVLGLVIELFHPGLIFPGVVGGVSIILLLYASQVLPVNGAAILLILLAVVLFIAEIKITSYGLLTVGGVVCVVLGGLMLFRTGPDIPGMAFRVSYITIFSVLFIVLAFVFLVLDRVFRVHQSQVTTGSQGLIGQIGEARTDINPKGTVFLHGELWNAVSDTMIEKDSSIEVISMQGLTLKVKQYIIT